MNNQLRAQIRRSLSLKETNELLRIWKKHDENEWSDLAFDAIREILQERHIQLPPPIEKEHWVQIDSEGNWLSELNIEDLEKFRPTLEQDQQLLTVAQISGDRKKEGEHHLGLGSTFTEMTLFGNAIKHFEQALVIFRALGDQSQEASVLAHLGAVNFFLKRKAAIEYYEQSLNWRSRWRSSSTFKSRFVLFFLHK
jgi:tetratricopeptide (TPR) repeat protein